MKDISQKSVVNDADDERRRKSEEKGKGKKFRFRGEKRCYTCGKTGHIAIHCRNQRNERKRKRDDSSSEDENESEEQRRMKKAARVLMKGSRVYDLAMAAAAIMRGGEKKDE